MAKQTLTTIKDEHFGIARKIVSNMTTESWETIPHCAATYDAEVTKFMQVLKEINSTIPKEEKITVNTAMMRVIVEAIKACPEINSHIYFNRKLVRGEVKTFKEINISMPTVLHNGEKVMAVCRIIKDSNGDNVGAIRVLSSLEQIDRQVTTLIFLVLAALIIVFALIIFSNLFFIRSIIFPVQEITETTKKISQGDYSARIEKKYDDEIGNLCDSINTMAEEISTTDKMKNDFISTISHELRTPLTSIKGWGETLMLGTDDSVDELTRKGLQVIVKEAGRLEGFVEELLDFSRLQSGRMNLRLAKTDLFAELDETVFTFRERALRDGIEVKYSIPEVPAIANADANRLKQVFMNILDNALKYSRSPSKIFVKAEFTKLDNQNFVKIAIADQGCGISKEDLPHVKEKFYKANVSVRGSGIGLAVTNEIVNLHHGKLEIDSQEGKGTLVTIYLPVENSPTKNELNDMKQNETVQDAEINEGVEINKN